MGGIMAYYADSRPHDILPQVSKASSQGFLEFISKHTVENTRWPSEQRDKV